MPNCGKSFRLKHKHEGKIMKTETEDKDLETKDDAVTDDDTASAAVPADTTEYTRDKQMADQERANARKAREETQVAQDAFEEASERATKLERELVGLKAANDAEKQKLHTQQQKLEDMDPDLVDAKVIKNIQQLEQRLRDQDSLFQQQKSELLGQLKELSGKAQTYEQERQTAMERERHDKTVEGVLSTVEKSLKRHGIAGAEKYRTEALKLADELVDSGQAERPNDPFSAVDFMEDCYLKVKDKYDKGKSKTVSVDTGKSGVGPVAKTKRKTGSLDEIAADMLNDKSWKKDEPEPGWI